MKKLFVGVVILLIQITSAQEPGITEKNLNIDQFTDGTLTLPENNENVPLVIFIQGSGPVNRDGNGPMMKNDGVKKIAHELAENGIASFRFDKRIFKMDKLKVREQDLRFEDFVTDVNSILDHFRNKQNYSKIILAGHSEGSLIGILAAQNGKADALISLAGAGRNINIIIVEQIAKQSGELSENANIAFEEMLANGSTTNYSPYLESIFRPGVQPYMISWMKYDPAEEISRLEIPILVVNGTFDLQVDVTDAEILQQANPNTELRLIENMNHIFREIKGENLENTKAYNEAYRPLHPELIPALTGFIQSIE